MLVEAGERIAIIGANGAGKTTMLRSIGDAPITGLSADTGTVKWAENANPGYMPQDPTDEFATDTTLTDWMGQWTKEGDDDQAVRSILGRLLFGGDEVKKSVRVLSGGEKGRMMYGKLMLGRHNVLLLDEPTNHMDMESIESLNVALDKYAGTLIFVSHDHEFVSSLANRIIEIKENEVVDFHGNYEDYLTSQGIA
jgi:ATPase subunit of ABC transporter with duplicated ATPase domains